MKYQWLSAYFGRWFWWWRASKWLSTVYSWCHYFTQSFIWIYVIEKVLGNKNLHIGVVLQDVGLKFQALSFDWFWIFDHILECDIVQIGGLHRYQQFFTLLLLLLLLFVSDFFVLLLVQWWHTTWYFHYMLNCLCYLCLLASCWWVLCLAVSSLLGARKSQLMSW